MLTIFLRSVILYAASLLAMRAMGKRQVGQLQPFELVVVIMIAELAATPMGRFGQAEELLGALLFLLNNEAASFVTGVVIPVDGGFSAYSGV